MSIWDDLRLDECDADLLVVHLAATARAMAEAASVLTGDRPIVSEDWRGAYRVEFDEVLPALLASLGEAIATVEGAAALVRLRMEAGLAEQRRRVQARQGG
jgi:hypothetical protein